MFFPILSTNSDITGKCFKKMIFLANSDILKLVFNKLQLRYTLMFLFFPILPSGANYSSQMSHGPIKEFNKNSILSHLNFI